MKKYKFAFVILHYRNIEETMQCVASIEEKFDVEDYLIVIVDNGSNNGTGEFLQQKYSENEYIRVISNLQNLGFARGNNVGFRYAKAHGSDFICMVNSDTYLINDNFGQSIIRDYEAYKFFVLGPDVIASDKEFQSNPLGNHVLKYSEMWKRIISLQVQIGLSLIRADKLIACVQKARHKGDVPNVFDRNCYHKNVKLHGCCIIFSPEYIAEYDGINDCTFLYMEEDLLYHDMMRKGHLTLYSPNVKIFHVGAASTQMASSRKRKLFVLRNHLRSTIAIRRYMRQLRGN